MRFGYKVEVYSSGFRFGDFGDEWLELRILLSGCRV